MTIPYPELVPKNTGSHRTPRCRNKKIGKQRRINLHVVETIRVMVMAGIVIGVGCIGLWIKQLSHVQANAGAVQICIRLADIPPPPSPTEEQVAAINYTNDYLFQLRTELGCGE